MNLLLSGPAGGVTGAAWVAEQAGFPDFLTFDMGGSSTDVALAQGLSPRIGRETRVGDLTVRATSVDVRTVGACGRVDRARPAVDPSAACRPAVRRILARAIAG
ncbi:hydantoinase/oxoprolinase family protein [Nocardia wallacei]|uniref:hydantoinase/oxoprolinase family protein n=1 Tax=Nocardia wallacei TaxID=480035 RepID=UPI0024567E4F|nr:hydantoinase/oxoprolinase family protein [Nocardia wallacei]